MIGLELYALQNLEAGGTVEETEGQAAGAATVTGQAAEINAATGEALQTWTDAPIVDDFNRSNESPATGWTTMSGSDGVSAIVSNKLTLSGGGSVSTLYRAGETYEGSIDISALLTMGAVGDFAAIKAIQTDSTSLADTRGYTCVYVRADDKIKVYRFVAGPSTSELFVSGTRSFASGDKLGLRINAKTGNIHVFHNDVLIGTVRDTSVQPGPWWAGVHFDDGAAASGWSWDDFRAGEAFAGATVLGETDTLKATEGDSDGAATVTGVSGAIKGSDGDSDGQASVTSAAAALAQTEGDADGQATVTTGSGAIKGTVGDSQGQATVSGEGADGAAGAEGSSAGQATVTGVSGAVKGADGDADGQAAVTSASAAIARTEGDADGQATVAGQAASVKASEGDSDGQATVAGQTQVIAGTDGSSSGTAQADGASGKVAGVQASAAGQATVDGQAEDAGAGPPQPVVVLIADAKVTLLQGSRNTTLVAPAKSYNAQAAA